MYIIIYSIIYPINLSINQSNNPIKMYSPSIFTLSTLKYASLTTTTHTIPCLANFFFLEAICP